MPIRIAPAQRRRTQGSDRDPTDSRLENYRMLGLYQAGFRLLMALSFCLVFFFSPSIFFHILRGCAGGYAACSLIFFFQNISYIMALKRQNRPVYPFGFEALGDSFIAMAAFAYLDLRFFHFIPTAIFGLELTYICLLIGIASFGLILIGVAQYFEAFLSFCALKNQRDHNFSNSTAAFSFLKTFVNEVFPHMWLGSTYLAVAACLLLTVFTLMTTGGSLPAFTIFATVGSILLSGISRFVFEAIRYHHLNQLSRVRQPAEQAGIELQPLVQERRAERPINHGIVLIDLPRPIAHTPSRMASVVTHRGVHTRH